MSMRTEYGRYVGEWSQATDPAYLNMASTLERLGVEWRAIAKARDYPAYHLWWNQNIAEWERCINGMFNHRDERLDDYWDEFEAWAKGKGYEVHKGMPLWHSMTAWADGGYMPNVKFKQLTQDEYNESAREFQ